MINYDYIYCENEKEFIEAQKILFNDSYEWIGTGKNIEKNQYYPIIIAIENKNLSHVSVGDIFYIEFLEYAKNNFIGITYKNLSRKLKFNKLYDR